MHAGVEDALFHFGGTSPKAVVMEESLILERAVLVFDPPEFEIGNVNSPSSFTSLFAEEAINFLTVDVFHVDPVLDDAKTPSDPLLGSMAASS